MSRYAVTAPLVVARLEDGSVRYLYENATVPTSDLAKGELARLRDGGFIAATEEPRPAAAKPAGPPARNGSRDDWAAYALTLGATEADLEGQTRDYIRDLVDLHVASKS
jgi:hypothetical protein